MNMRERINSKLELMKEEHHGHKNFEENIEEKPLFFFIFLKNDEDQSVEVKDVKVDFAEVEKRLEGGKSVFISRKCRQLGSQE